MPRSALYEESAVCADMRHEQRMYKVFHITSIVCLAIVAFFVFFSLSFIPGMISKKAWLSLILWVVPMLLFVGFFFLFWKLKRRYNVSYDYTFVEDELRITKVFNGKSRKYLVTLKADQMLQIGYEGSSSYERLEAGLHGKKPKYMTPNREPAEGKIFIYIHYSSAIEKTLYILECRKEMLEYLVFAAGRNKFQPQ